MGSPLPRRRLEPDPQLAQQPLSGLERSAARSRGNRRIDVARAPGVRRARIELAFGVGGRPARTRRGVHCSRARSWDEETQRRSCRLDSCGSHGGADCRRPVVVSPAQPALGDAVQLASCFQPEEPSFHTGAYLLCETENPSMCTSRPCPMRNPDMPTASSAVAGWVATVWPFAMNTTVSRPTWMASSLV